ncbi:MAG TPA: hypothetical protein VH116_12905 [Gemmatimonadales bacterium]|jgi:hypothetical protein|nr:hypothetical protein [Gemmatimonadales bacterium]
MVRKLLGVALTLGLPAILSAQAPETSAGKSAVTHGKATRRLGDVVRTAEPKEDTDRDRDDRAKTEDKDQDRDDRGRNPNAATPAKPATPAVPAHGEGPATRAKPATPAVPSPKSGGHKP